MFIVPEDIIDLHTLDLPEEECLVEEGIVVVIVVKNIWKMRRKTKATLKIKTRL